MKKLFLFLMLGIFLFSFASAEPHKQNADYELIVSSNYATECQMNYIKYPDGTKNIYNINLTKDDTSFYTTINGTNFTQAGGTCMNIKCTYGSEVQTENKCLDVTASGTSDNNFISFTILYLIVLVISYVLVYKFATYNGGAVKEGFYFYWAGFLDLSLFVILQVYGVSGAEGVLVDVIKFICFGSGLSFLAMGMIDSIWGWNKKK